MSRLLIICLVLFIKLNGLAQSITAGIVTTNDNYVPLVVDYTVRSSYSTGPSSTTPGITYSVDINNDGELDFEISGGVTKMGALGFYRSLWVKPLLGTITSKQVASSIKSCTYTNNPYTYTVTAAMANMFNGGDLIDSTTTWDTSPAYLYTSQYAGPNGCSLQNFYSAPAYIGVRLICGNIKFYGWIKVKNLNFATTPFIELQVESYAINKSTFICGVGINEQSMSKNVLVFPNPTQNFLNIKFPEDISSVTISLTDITGKIVINDKIIASGESLNISYLSKGLYTVIIKAKDFTIHKKLVKE
ncbi:MAG: T9SS type A sorting domain-containing protein [Sphingobacteriaceae bacterium]|nr:T9SS type A sorting domain-containing protein [Sphingobacteriaceae bacterium]